ncbi:MAG: flagellar basal body-associated FliL family protein [Planctomycetes bacterium]|nr:flagellar basal body-associated FliL family protein [Planctomycetota bacterium]
MNIKKIALLGGVGLASAAAGIAIPQMMQGKSHEGADPAKAEAAGHEAGHDKKKAKADDHGAGGHGATDAHGKEGTPKVVVNGPTFIPFGRTVVNLNDPALARYLSLEVTMQADGQDEEEVKTALESRKPILQTWLTSHLADKSLEDIRGKVGVNRLRREIQDNFNALLFTDGRERIQDILFEEFYIQ